MSSKKLTKNQLIKLYRDMLLLRRFEERAAQKYTMGEIAGFCHLYIGQEAIAVGMQTQVRTCDSVITTYRDHGLMLANGADPKVIMAELMGKETGCSKGKGGSMHIFDLKNNFYGGHGIVGASVPLGTGLAFAHNYRKDGGISFTYLGDGAANQGQVYEAFNMASLWKLPVIYIIENNEYGMGTSVERASATTDLYKRGEGFGIPGHRINGMDVFAVIDAAKTAIRHIKSGKGPILLEMKSYRYRGHSMSDPGNYRTKEEVQNVKDRNDCIGNIKEHLISNKVMTGEECKKHDKEIQEIVKEAISFAENSNLPREEELYTDIYHQA
ncbi:MAG: pyruvate dehydrogenase (acetyl-transferring) E1 component subunit alpha [Rickettsiaceae bacterium H1]|nr:pyruvate dehydrogenase (acetyl-transferring) E1 component subunit alpha [Rickettsiaceae bacterium H1]